MTTKQLERRTFDASPEIRSNPDGTVGVRGYFAVWDSVAHGEVIRRGAFDRTIAQRDDIRLLVNHDGTPLARTKSGTLVLGADDHGAWFDAPSLDVENNPTARELVSALSRGDIDQCSFAGYFSKRKNDGLDEVFEVKGLDVSIVTYPWYEETSAGLTGSRDLDRALVALRSLTPEQRAEVIAGVDLQVDVAAAARCVSNARIASRTAPAGQMSWSDRAELVTSALDSMTGEWCFIEDIGDDWVVYVIYPNWDQYLLASWSIDASGVIAIGESTRVAETYVPVADSGAAATAAPSEGRCLSIAEARSLLTSAAA